MMTPEQASSGEINVIAPDGFLEAALSETILAVVPIRRRAMFQFGPALPADPCGHVDSGLERGVGRGTTGLIAPNGLITEELETHVIDRVEIVFQLTPETEAPTEMNFSFLRPAYLTFQKTAAIPCTICARYGAHKLGMRWHGRNIWMMR